MPLDPDLVFVKVCPWTLILTMAMSMMKVVLPHYRSILPYITDDVEAKIAVETMLASPDFDKHIEKFFIDDIKVGELL